MADQPGPHDVILRDGRTFRLRPPSAGDADALLAFFSALSDRSLQSRFHGMPAVTARLVEPLIDPDWVERGSLLGFLVSDRVERVAAVARWTRLRDQTTAEVAFTVADELQQHGVGTRMLEQLAATAIEAGVERFIAEVLPDNKAMLNVFDGAGFEVTRCVQDGVVQVEFPIAATEPYRERMDARDHVAVTASLKAFFEPASVAVIGASRREASIGGAVFKNIVAGNFDGTVFPVNRAGASVAGVKGYASVSAIPDPVDLAVIVVPAESVVDIAREALSAGVRALCVISAGFAEVGSEGAQRQRELLGLVRAHGARLIGPNCLGLAVGGVRLNATFAAREFPPGSVAFSSQSGALGLALLEQAEARGLGLSAFVSVGNKADVSTNDLLEWWEDDPQTDAIILYVESFGNPRKFARVAQRVARKKPILAMKSGRTDAGAHAASSHTAALAGSEAATVALFRETGVIRADTLEGLLDLAELFSSQPPPRGRRVGLLTNAGGLAILCADECIACGLELPTLASQTVAALRDILPAEASVENPVDMLGSATPGDYQSALSHLLADQALDAVIALFVPSAAAAASDVADAITAAVVGSNRHAKPVLAVAMSGDSIRRRLTSGEHRIAAYTYPESAARALAGAAKRAEWLRRPAGSVPVLDGLAPDKARELVAATLGSRQEVWLGPTETNDLLTSYGIPLVDQRVAEDFEAAAAAAEELGFPVAVKSASPGAHKTEHDAVALRLRTEDEVRGAAARIGGPVIVQPMISTETELLAGIVQDPIFGPLLAFGPGGVLAELVGEAEFRLAPLTDIDATELVQAGKAGRLVRGFRGAQPADIHAVADLLHRLGQLGADLPEVAEIDLNPVVTTRAGCLALDARVRLAIPHRQRETKTW